MPFFGAWLAWRGLSPSEIGIILSVGMLLRVFIAPITGVIADARNDRRSAMLFLYVMMLAAYASLNWSRGAILIGAATILASIGSGSVFPLLESVSIRLSERFGYDYGRVRLWGSSVFVAGNFASGFLVSQFGLVVIAPWMTLALLANVLSVYVLPKPQPDPKHRVSSLHIRATFAEAHELLKSPVFLIFLAAASLDQASHAFYYTYGGLHWRELGYSGTLIGAIWPLGVFAEIALLFFSLPVFRALGATRLLLLGALCGVVRWTILAFDPPLPFVILAQLLHGGTFALAHLGAMYFILKAVPPRLSAAAQSLYAVGSSGLAMGLATYLSGPLYAAIGGRAYLLMSAMAVVSALFALWLARKWHGGRITQSDGEHEIEAVI